MEFGVPHLDVTAVRHHAQISKKGHPQTGSPWEVSVPHLYTAAFRPSFYTHLFWEIKPPTSAQYLIKNKLVAHGRLAFLIFTQQQLDLMHRSLRRVILTAAKLNMWCQIYTHLFWEIKPPTSAQHLIKNKLAAHGRMAFFILTSQQLDIMHRSPRRVILTAAKLNMWCQFYTHPFWEIKPPTSAQHLIKNKLPAHGRLAFLILTSQQLDIMHRSPRRVILKLQNLTCGISFTLISSEK